MYTELLSDFQRELAAEIGGNIDVHYSDGKGALFVPEGAALVPQNVIFVVSEMELRLYAMGRRVAG